jgi:hypothetical protein
MIESISLNLQAPCVDAQVGGIFDDEDALFRHR